MGCMELNIALKNRSRLADAQQIAEHKPVESERSQTKQSGALSLRDGRFLHKPARNPKRQGCKQTAHGDTRQRAHP